MVIRYRGTSPKLGSCQGECPYPCDEVSFFVVGGGGVVDDARLSSPSMAQAHPHRRMIESPEFSNLQRKQLETKTGDICVIRGSKPSGEYIMNFYRLKYISCRKMESGGHTRCSRGRGARPGGQGVPSTLVEGSCPPWTATYFSIFLNIPKRRNIALKIVLESVYLPYHIPIPLRSLEHSGKCPLCIPQGLRFQ